MNIDKLKKFISDKPLWIKIVVSIFCIFIIGFSAWFGFTSCASVDVDKLNVNTDKVQVDVEGVKVHPKDVSLVNNRDDAFNHCYRLEDL